MEAFKIEISGSDAAAQGPIKIFLSLRKVQQLKFQGRCFNSQINAAPIKISLRNLHLRIKPEGVRIFRFY
jgi:hypothetical protein